MKKIHVMFFLLFVFTGAVFAGWYGLDFKTIENKKAGYSIEVPLFWEINQDELDKTGDFYPVIDQGEGIYIGCYIVKLTGKYDAVKKDIVKGFRKEVFADFDKMYGKDSLTIKTHKKSSCKKINGIEVCSAVFNYDYKADGPQRTFFGIFKTKKGAYKVFFSSSPENFEEFYPPFEELVLGKLKLIK